MDQGVVARVRRLVGPGIRLLPGQECETGREAAPDGVGFALQVRQGRELRIGGRGIAEKEQPAGLPPRWGL